MQSIKDPNKTSMTYFVHIFVTHKEATLHLGKCGCRDCYTKDRLDIFHVNELLDKDGSPLYDDPSDYMQFRVGINSSHILIHFQCDL